MRLNPPKVITWLIAVIIGVLGILMYFKVFAIPGFAVKPFYLEMAAFVLLALATLLSGL